VYKVIIIDDEPWSREVIKSLVCWEKYCMDIVGEAEDGAEGIDLAKNRRPDVIITDMRMPGLEGDELLRELRKLYPMPEIIVMSGFNDFAYLKQAIQSKAVNYLLKPIDPLEIDATLRQCRQELDISALNSTQLFTDKVLMERYYAYRQQIRELLMKHNRRELSCVMDKLENILCMDHVKSINSAALKKAGYDLLLILDEFETEENISVKCSTLLEQQLETGWSSAHDAILSFSLLLFKAIDSADNSTETSNIDLALVQQYIDHHFTEPLSLESIAKRFYISREYLCRSFKLFAGENISDYITKRRMEKSHALVLQKKYEIKDIATIVGYNDIAYFYRVFKKYYGCTPGDLRR
jgi:two-component system, response regulator YesN